MGIGGIIGTTLLILIPLRKVWIRLLRTFLRMKRTLTSLVGQVTIVRLLPRTWTPTTLYVAMLSMNLMLVRLSGGWSVGKPLLSIYRTKLL